MMILLYMHGFLNACDRAFYVDRSVFSDIYPIVLVHDIFATFNHEFCTDQIKLDSTTQPVSNTSPTAC